MALRTIAPAGWAPVASDVRGRLTTNDLSADIKPTHFEELTYWDADDQGDGNKIISASEYPLVNLVTFLGEEAEVIDNYQFNEWEMLPSSDFIIVAAAGAAAAATTIPLNDGEASKVHEGQVFFNPATGERLRVPYRRSDIDESGNQLTNVTRGLGASPDATIAGGTKLLLVAPSRPEGAADGSPNFAKPFTYSNYLQEMSVSAGITDRAEVLKHYSGRDWTQEQKEKSRDFRRQIQNAWLFGIKDSGTDVGDSYPWTSTNGIHARITTNYQDVSGQVLTYGLLDEIFEPFFRYRGPKNSSGVKHALCGPVVKSAIRKALVDKGELQIQVREMAGRKMEGIKFGYRVEELYLSWGTLVLHTMARWSDVEELRDKMLVIDPTLLQPVYRRGGEVQMRTPILADGVTRKKKTWYADCGLRTKMEAAHGWVEGFGK